MKNEITVTITISGALAETVQSVLAKCSLSSDDLGQALQSLLGNLPKPANRERLSGNGRRSKPDHGPLMQYGKEIEADESTPLTICALADYLGCSRSRINGDIRRGYVLEFGTRTSPAHYLAWLRKNPKRRGNPDSESRMQKELSRLT